MGNDMATATPSSSAGAQATHALRQARDASSRVISAAADADEQGKTVEAVTMYREGLSLIRRALQGLKLGKDESWADARRIAAHMERTRDAVEDIVQKRSGKTTGWTKAAFVLICLFLSRPFFFVRLMMTQAQYSAGRTSSNRRGGQAE